MEISEKAKFDLEKRNGDPLTYTSSNLSSNWQFSSTNHSNLLGLITMDDSVDTCRDSLRGGTNETMDSNWNPPRGNGFLQIASQMIPQTLSEFPADSSFIERAARFSCFNGGGFGDMGNPYKTSESMNPYSKEDTLVQGSFEVFAANGLKHAVCGGQPQMNKQNGSEGSQDVVESGEQCAAVGSLPKERDIVENARSPEEASKECDVPYEAEVSGSCRQVERSMLEAGGLPSASKGHSAKKRKRVGQVTESNKVQGSRKLQEETAKDDNGPKHKNDKNPSTPSKATKHVKDSSQNSDAAKEDYIHVRARRGQATNSHSLAERVRREKISERMKFLQDLVPGCNKVTGKAVMLDEIINYVQSLQRQVEFLSMKLATVNPQFDLNVEGLLAKDIQQSRGGPSMLPFAPDANMVHAQLHPSQQGLMHAGIPGTGNPLDALRRPTNSQLLAMTGGGYKDSSQLPNMWVDELNNVFQMNFGTNGSFSGQELNGPLTSGHMKVEL